MSTPIHNPFLRGFQGLSYERVVQISYADDCPPCYRSLYPALADLPDDGINFQPCLFDDDFAVIGSYCCIEEVAARLRADHVPPVLLRPLLMAGEADTRLLIFAPDARPLPELPLFTED